MKAPVERYETEQPWVLFRYGRTHDLWWPFWNSTRFLGYALLDLECMVCGDRTTCRVRMPRFGAVPEWPSGRHPLRERYCEEHAHLDRGHPMSWATPLANLAAHEGGLNLDQLAMRLETDLNTGPEETP